MLRYTAVSCVFALALLCAPVKAAQADPATQVRDALRAGARERTVGFYPFASLSAAAPQPLPDRFTMGPLPDKRVLHESKSLAGIVQRLRALKAREGPDSLTPHLVEAGACLESEEPALRGAACEFLAHFPVDTVELDLLPTLGQLLNDDAVAYPDVPFAEPHRSAEFQAQMGTSDVRVQDLARVAVRCATGLTFPDADRFQTWWKANGDYRRRLWYWAQRWRDRDPRADIDMLDDTDFAMGLRIFILADCEQALRNEAAMPWLASGAAWHADQVLGPPVHWRVSYESVPTGPRQPLDADRMVRMEKVDSLRITPRVLASFVRRTRQRRRLLEVLAGAATWSATGVCGSHELEACMDAIAAGRHVFGPEDAAFLRAVLQRRVGLAGHVEKVHRELVLLVAELDAEKAEEVLLSAIEREPGDPVLPAALMDETGAKHWDLIKSIYMRQWDGQAELPEFPDRVYMDRHPDTKPNIVRAVSRLERGARERLAELFSVEQLGAGAAPTHGPSLRGPESYKQRLFQAFVDACRETNGGEPVVPPDLAESACYEVSKDMRLVAEHNAGVPAARERAIRLIEQFLDRTGTASGPQGNG
ncbi:MAG: hypothetical protein R6X33_02510 [Candidatus Brocadiia bacterium]